ncbi:uncharacterized protein A4U43_C10F10530 [Asparagus officinalis]|uniref:Major facilitator superfamily (MFS) profile domain-containing protein n=1 Tax=Asparagus officinalis TaxID=4686 RepID=A0A5P1E269_ASPOF|nr:protein NRT1/ PTR FAMILY 5.10-like isoform X2 [Asparagus officinalis]ONK56598.1 uncharacterized protein A4U43_C10F10530 [Asparagus officinalis]
MTIGESCQLDKLNFSSLSRLSSLSTLENKREHDGSCQLFKLERISSIPVSSEKDKREEQTEPKMDSDPLIHRPTSAVDHRSRPISRSSTGGWTSALFIIGVELAERSSYYGISLNLITYLTGDLGESTASAAAGVNTWYGVSQMMPLLGAFVADSYFGRYWTIAVASLFYVLGLGLLTLSAILPNLNKQLQVILFYFSLYLVAFAQGGHKPCVQAFGADQFDERDPQERISRSSFFNWWYFGMNAGMMVSLLVLTYVQDNISWGLGFGIPCILMVIALAVFLMGTKSYRYYLLEDESPFVRIGRTFTILIKSNFITKEGESRHLHGDDESKLNEHGDELSIRLAEEARGVLRLFPIWATCLGYAVVFAQSPTFFTKQGATMDRRIGSTFQVPPAALQSLTCVAILAFIPIYARIIVPISRNISKRPSGLTPLQRIGTGLIVSITLMVVSALVEIRRLKTAQEFGLIDRPDVMIPMSIWWLVPQYILLGICDVFTMVGLQEFFYDQVPDALKSLGLALYLSIFGIGNFISSFLVSVIDGVTKSAGESWFSNNLNHAHLDYYYWLLAGLSAVVFVIYMYSAQSYVYKKIGSGAL